MENNVPYHSRSKKSELMQLFKDAIVPQIPSLREKYLNVDSNTADIIRIPKRKKSFSALEETIEGSNESSGNNNVIGKKKATPMDIAFSSDSNSALSSESDSEFTKQIRRGEAVTPKSKKRKIEKQTGTPILDRVSSKSPSKTPNKSRTIETFDLSSSSPSPVALKDSSLYRNVSSSTQPPLRTPTKAAEFDFSQKRRTLSPDLDKLKVSAAFAQQLKKAVKENEKKSKVPSFASMKADSDSDSEIYSIFNEQDFDSIKTRRKALLGSDSDSDSEYEKAKRMVSGSVSNTDTKKSSHKNSKNNSNTSFENMPSFKSETSMSQKDIPSGTPQEIITILESSDEEEKNVKENIPTLVNAQKPIIPTTPHLPTKNGAYQTKEKTNTLQDKINGQEGASEPLVEEMVQDQIRPAQPVTEDELISEHDAMIQEDEITSEQDDIFEEDEAISEKNDIVNEEEEARASKDIGGETVETILELPLLAAKNPNEVILESSHIKNTVGKNVSPTETFQSRGHVELKTNRASASEQANIPSSSSDEELLEEIEEFEEQKTETKRPKSNMSDKIPRVKNNSNLKVTALPNAQKKHENKTEPTIQDESLTKKETFHVKFGRSDFINGLFRKCYWILKKLLTLTVLTFILFFGFWYREQKFQVGYCGTELRKPMHLPNGLKFQQLMQLDELLQENFRPQCVPCPDNAICYPYLKLKCKPKYRLVKPLLGLNGLLPLSDSCVRDDQREQLVSEAVRKSLDFLRSKNAQISCGDGNDDIKSGLNENELFQIFNEARAAWISDEEFNEIWDQVVSNLKNEPEIIYRQVSNTEFLIAKAYDDQHFTNNIITCSLQSSDSISRNAANVNFGSNDFQKQKGHIPKGDQQKEQGYFRSTSKKYISLRCKFEGEIHQNYQRYRYLIWVVVSILVLVKILERKLRNYYETKVKIINLTRKVINELKQVKKNGRSPKYLSSIQLRDIFLIEVVNLKEKNQLWKQIERKLENNNSNIKSSLLEVHGDIMKCWEWIGPLDDNISDKH